MDLSLTAFNNSLEGWDNPPYLHGSIDVRWTLSLLLMAPMRLVNGLLVCHQLKCRSSKSREEPEPTKPTELLAHLHQLIWWAENSPQSRSNQEEPKSPTRQQHQFTRDSTMRNQINLHYFNPMTSEDLILSRKPKK